MTDRLDAGSVHVKTARRALERTTGRPDVDHDGPGVRLVPIVVLVDETQELFRRTTAARPDRRRAGSGPNRGSDSATRRLYLPDLRKRRKVASSGTPANGPVKAAGGPASHRRPATTTARGAR